MTDRVEVGRFLRARREALRPEDVGLSSGPRRRVAGLRREEVAMLSSMSADYYRRIEQGRAGQPSPEMLAVIARILRLTTDECDHLYRLAGHNPPDHVSGIVHVTPGLQRVLDRLSDTPAMIVSDIGETLSQNHLADALFGARTQSTGLERSNIYRWFATPEFERRMYPDEDRPRQSRALVASLRVALGRRGPESVAAVIAADLERRSPEFAELWTLQEAAVRYRDHKVLRHREVGDLEFDCQALFTEDQSQTLVVLTVDPRSDSAERLKLLGVVGTTQFTSPYESAT